MTRSGFWNSLAESDRHFVWMCLNAHWSVLFLRPEDILSHHDLSGDFFLVCCIEAILCRFVTTDVSKLCDSASFFHFNIAFARKDFLREILLIKTD